MLTKQISKQTFLTQRYFAKIAIIAGDPSQDYRGAMLMKELKNQSNDDIEFFGLGGNRMKTEGLRKNYANLDKIHLKPWYPFKNILRNMWDRAYNPVMAPLRIKNRQVFKEMEKNNFFSDLEKNQPDCIIGLGNFLFQRKIFQEIEENCKLKGIKKPGIIFFNNLNINYVINDEAFMDHVFYRVPKKNVNWEYYNFPGTFTGSQGLWNVYKFLYERSPTHKGLISNNKIYQSRGFNQLLTEELIFQERKKFREANNIDVSTTLFFVSPGNEEKEVSFCLPKVEKAVDLFIQEYTKDQTVTRDNFMVVVSVPEEYTKLKSLVTSQKWKCQVICVDTKEDRMSAMAASDMGVVMDGDTVTEAAGMQLPVLIMDTMGWWESYYCLLYNSFLNDLSIGLNGEAYPELCYNFFIFKCKIQIFVCYN